jgi:hypothetical protein
MADGRQLLIRVLDAARESGILNLSEMCWWMGSGKFGKLLYVFRADFLACSTSAIIHFLFYLQARLRLLTQYREKSPLNSTKTEDGSGTGSHITS